MLPQLVIERKRDGETLSADEIRAFVEGFTRGTIPDYQVSALAMAIFFRGLNEEETVALTRAMTESGQRLDLSTVPGPKIDKHSTGGIGDKVSLILAPLVAACGVKVPMISGRGLGITGGTLDKLESIPGYRTRIEPDRFRSILAEVGCSIIGQSEEIAPADRKMYALRDVTGTVPSVPLITASILSKKLAEGIDGLVLDVKCGRGAFMKSVEEARALAASLRNVAQGAGCPTSVLITSMDQPLGCAVGNALEVREAIDLLRGEGPEDVRDLVLRLASEMLILGGIETKLGDALERATDALRRGDALDVFRAMVRAHGGRLEVVDDPSLLPSAPRIETIAAARPGYVEEVAADRVGTACLVLGAGRRRVEDRVNPAVGVECLCHVGNEVMKGDPLFRVHVSDPASYDEAHRLLREAVVIGREPAEAPPLVLGEWVG